VGQVLALLLVVLGLVLVAVWLTALELRSAQELELVEGWQAVSRQAQAYSLEQLKAQELEQE
jgi:hypothetical protein